MLSWQSISAGFLSLASRTKALRRPPPARKPAGAIRTSRVLRGALPKECPSFGWLDPRPSVREGPTLVVSSAKSSAPKTGDLEVNLFARGEPEGWLPTGVGRRELPRGVTRHQFDDHTSSSANCPLVRSNSLPQNLLSR